MMYPTHVFQSDCARETARRTIVRVKRGLAAVGLVAAVGLPTLVPGGTASAQSYGCNPAYVATASYCIPNVPYDLNCVDIGYAVVQLVDPYNDPYGLDVYNGVGNGWTCDGVG